ncbi:MAG: Sec-independent protein translocase protein TatB [Polyangiales bacterium]
MFGIGTWEIFVIAVVALVVLGPKRLPQALKTVGRGIGQFRRAVTQIKEEVGYDEVVDEVVRPLREGMHDLNAQVNKEIAASSARDVDVDDEALGITTEYPEGGPDDYGAVPEKSANEYAAAAYGTTESK